MTSTITDEQIAAGTSYLRNKPLDTVEPTILVIDVKGERYQLDVNSLNYFERQTVANFLGADAGPLGVELIVKSNEMAAYVAAYIAVRRVHEDTAFSEIGSLAVKDLDVILPEDVEDLNPLADDSSTSSAPAATTAQTSSDEPLPEGSSSEPSPTGD